MKKVIIVEETKVESTDKANLGSVVAVSANKNEETDNTDNCTCAL